MAVKKSTTKKGTTGAAKKAGAKAGATKKAKATAKKTVRTGTAAKANTPKAKAKKSAGAKAGAAKKKAAVKINDRQRDLLSRVRGAGTVGYFAGKGEQRTLDALHQRRLLTRGAKDKARGAHSYTVSKSGEKHLGPAGGAGSSGGMGMG